MNVGRSIRDALKGSRIQILSIFFVYAVSCAVGILMVHNGDETALAYRDAVVKKAVQGNISQNYQAGNTAMAAIMDFGGNLFLSAVPQTIAGLTVLVPYFTVAYQGWIGGIVSVDNLHESRFDTIQSTLYYFIVLLLNYIPFSLSIGSGIKLGLNLYKRNAAMGWNVRKYRIKKEYIFDVLRVYVVCVPVFFLASWFEYMSAWNI